MVVYLCIQSSGGWLYGCVPLYPVLWWLVDKQAGHHAHTQVDTTQDEQQAGHTAQQVRVSEVPVHNSSHYCIFPVILRLFLS